jgi:SAM-dependent methyltransferase
VQPALETKGRPEQGATRLELAMLRTRYAWASGQAANKDVAEIACGAGPGLGWLARMARRVEAGDPSDANCRIARETYEGRAKVRVRALDALDLPFERSSLDLVLLFEAIYDLADAEVFFDEARRVLRPGGSLLISTVNREWTGFTPSRFHSRCFSAAELKQALASHGFSVKVYAGFPERRGVLQAVIRPLRRAAVAMNVLPKTTVGQAFLKRYFYGSLQPIPKELAPGGATEPLYPLSGGMDISIYRTVYMEAQKIR